MNAMGQEGTGTEANDVAPPDVSILDISQTTMDLDEDFWRMNESLLGQQYLNSFFMGNDTSIFGDGTDLAVDDQLPP